MVFIGRKKKEKTGSIYFDKKDKKWKLAYYITNPQTMLDERAYKSFDTQEEAKNFLINIEYQKGNDLYLKNNGIPINLLMRAKQDEKLRDKEVCSSTYIRNIETIQCIEKNPISTKKIDEISSREIKDYFSTLTHYSNSQIKKIKEQFSQVFRYAKEKNYIAENPMIDVKRPKSKKKDKDVRALEVEEQQIFTSYLLGIHLSDNPYRVAFLIEMYLGLRVGETLALRSTDIDLRKNVINVSRTLTKDLNHNIIMSDSTKTYAGTREVPIPYFIRDDIISQMKIAETNRDKQLFLDKNGQYVRPNNATRELKNVLEKMGISDMTSHNLRHTYGTRCIESGMRAVAIQRLMGHKDINITLNTYTSVFNKYKEAELEKVNNYYMHNEIINQNQKELNKSGIVNNYKNYEIINESTLPTPVKNTVTNNQNNEKQEMLIFLEQAVEIFLKAKQKEKGARERDD